MSGKNGKTPVGNEITRERGHENEAEGCFHCGWPRPLPNFHNFVRFFVFRFENCLKLPRVSLVVVQSHEFKDLWYGKALKSQFDLNNCWKENRSERKTQWMKWRTVDYRVKSAKSTMSFPGRWSQWSYYRFPVRTEMLIDGLVTIVLLLLLMISVDDCDNILKPKVLMSLQLARFLRSTAAVSLTRSRAANYLFKF